MKITTTYYEFSIVGGEYTIENIHPSSTLYYVLYSMENSVQTVVEDDTIIPGATVTLSFPAEGLYRLALQYPSGIGSGVATTSYDLRYFPTTKSNIIDMMKSAICDCSSLDSSALSCTTSSVTPMTQDVYDTQALYTSIGLYRDMLLSPSFLRSYNCCLIDLMDDNSMAFLGLNKTIHDTINEEGNVPNSTQLVRLYTAYMYILFYTIEIDVAEYETGSSTGGATGNETDAQRSALIFPNDTDTDDVATIKALFDFEGMKECFNALGLDPARLYQTFDVCYRENLLGICSTEISQGADDSISNLSYATYSEYVNVGTVVTPALFTWEVSGISDKNLTLDDNGYGSIVAQSVTGTSYNSGAVTYTKAAAGSVTWTLDGSNVSPITLVVNWIYPVYTGKNITGVFPVEAEILAGTPYTGDVSTGFSYEPNTGVTEYSWAAIVATTPQYTQWDDPSDITNGALIGNESSSEFIIIKSATVSVNGIAYYVYMFNWNTEYTSTLYLR